MSVCKLCHAPIKWIRTEAGQHMPVDPQQVTRANENEELTIVTEEGITLVNPPVGRAGYVSHFATCPHAAGFRRLRRIKLKRGAMVK